MEFSKVASAIKSIEDEGICVCVLGEVALNYYNVPRVIHVWYSFLQSDIT